MDTTSTALAKTLLARATLGQIDEMAKVLEADMRVAGLTKEEARDFAESCVHAALLWVRENRTI